MNNIIRLGDYITEICEKTTANNQHMVLTSSQEGIVSQDDYFNKQVASKDNTGYKVIRRGQFTYRAMSDTGRFYINRLCDYDTGIVSPAYPVFELKKNEDILPDYLQEYFHSEQFQNSIALSSTGSTRVSLKLSKIADLRIAVPSISDQRHMIIAIQHVSNLISVQNSALCKLDELVKSRFIELFVGKDYEEKSVRDVLDTAFWLMPATPEFVENGSVPYITSKNIKNRSIDFDNVKYITIEAYESISSNRPTQIGDILISMIGTLGQTAVIKDARRFYGQNLYLLRLNASVVNTIFFCEFFNSDHTQHKLQAKRNQSTQAYLKANNVEDLILPLPPMELQEQFAAFVAEVDKSKFCIQKSLSASRKLWTMTRIAAIINMDFFTQRSL